MTSTGPDSGIHDRHRHNHSDEDFDILSAGGMMAGTAGSSPFIKDEPGEWSYDPNPHNYSGSMNAAFAATTPGSIDPQELTVQTGPFQPFSFGSQPNNPSSSFHMGNSGIGDDELLDLDLNDTSQSHAQLHNPSHARDDHHHHLYAHPDDANLPSFFPDPIQAGATHQHHGMHHVYSNTPDGAPIQSPFVHGNFNYGHFVPPPTLSQHVSPYMRPVSGNGIAGSYEAGHHLGARPRASLSHGLERKASDSRSPLTPKTPGMGAHHLGTPDSGSFPSQPIHATLNHRHQKSLSGHWGSASGSLHSYVDSPIASPVHGAANHAQISEVVRSGKPASLPTKVETGGGGNHHHPHPAPAYQTQEAKRRRRRESHNMVERRRRDNINERIQELSHLVPQHRLDDEKIRKHLANNSPLSPTLAATTGMSPPHATSLLAAAGGRRATGAGNITVAIPIEDKDKGPNKGDILNGSVGWTRDLMWALYVKYQQEAEVAERLARYGGTYPFTDSEDEKRMRSELMDAMEKNDVTTFEYTRGLSSGLRVPNHTTLTGEPLHHRAGGGGGGGGGVGTLSPQSLSPGVQSGGSGANSGGHGQPPFWTQHNGGRGSLKEEDEYGMDMN